MAEQEIDFNRAINDPDYRREIIQKLKESGTPPVDGDTPLPRKTRQLYPPWAKRLLLGDQSRP